MDENSGQTPIRPRQLIRDQVFATIAEEIVSGRMRAHEEIRDQDLQAEYGVSRTPIREALNRLAELGLVEVRTNRFTRVAPVDLNAQADRAEAAAAMIGYSAVTGMPGYTDAQIASLQRRIDDMLGTDLAWAATRAGLQHWYALWAEIVTNAGNRTMIGILDGQLALHLTRTVPDERVPEEFAAHMRTALGQLRDAVGHRDGRAARDVIEPLFAHVTIAPLRAAAAAGAGLRS